MAKKPESTAEKSWEELGLRPGIRVPGTTAWMTKWRESPNQTEMVEYAQKVDLLVGTMSEENVKHHIKKYLSGQWGSEEEVIIAAAIRRTPTIFEKYNQMEAQLMEKAKAKAEKATKKKAEGASLKARIESLEKEVEVLKAGIETLTKLAKKVAEPPKKREKKERETEPRKTKVKVSDDVKSLLKDLEKARIAEDKAQAAKIRAKLRKAGYSLRENGKK